STSATRCGCSSATRARCSTGPAACRPTTCWASPNPAWDAVLEAWLVHLRVLDEFLRLTRSEKGNAYARGWHARWNGRGFLDGGERNAIDRQVVHLNARRHSPAEWDVRGLTESACWKLIEFC